MKSDRKILRADAWTSHDFSETDQSRGIHSPAISKPVTEKAELVELPKPEGWAWEINTDFTGATLRRRSIRRYIEKTMDLEELSYLLWCTQAIRKNVNPATSKRYVPSAGSRHALETYLAVIDVEGLKQGIYRYLPDEHSLLYLYTPENLEAGVVSAVKGQKFCASSNVVFFWSAIPYRMEWRYSLVSSKLILLDAGHVCQNLYLGCDAIGCGTCAIAAYDQKAADQLVQVDGKEEMVIYIAPVGKKGEKL